MENNPLVTVNILSYNRQDELRNTLTKVYEQDYKNIEVIVVDNASKDGSPVMVKSEFPSVKLIRLEKNIGIAGWNEGFRLAKGEYVLVLDDDAYPEHNAISKALEEFIDDGKIACITFNMYDVETSKFVNDHWSPSELKSDTKFFWPVFIGCSAMFSRRNNNFENIMPSNYFIYQHELPVSADIYRNGYKILFNREIIAYHKFKNSNYYDTYKDSLWFKNNLLYINEYLPIYLAIPYSLQSILYYFLRSIGKGWVFKYFQIIKNINYCNKERKPISISYFIFLRKYHFFNFSIFSKLKNI